VRQYATFPTRSCIPTISPCTQVNLSVKVADEKAGILAELKGCAFILRVIGAFYFLSGSASSKEASNLRFNEPS
jgi:hypothetical protein